ncbi:MAG: MotA/TolQ/ExbB proton channel family protein [Candidatus Cloacimonetes bacterium]|nr:MotA/TolQ/ExbB proton channel family protein [Candidatus Cloacimonadota bacterium]
MYKKLSMLMLMIVVMSAFMISVANAEPAPLNAAGDVSATPEPTASKSTVERIAEFVFGSEAVKWFKNGGWAMWPILFITLYGLAYIIWKFIALMYAKYNLSTFLGKLIPLLQSGKIKEAAGYAQSTRGPVASVVYAGLLKAEHGIDAVEKAIENAAMIEMSYLEKGFIELSSAITLAPMMGFLGTVSGMITAFASIEAARAVDATIVANGIKIALITTQAGLIVAVPVQFFNNIFVTMVDGLVIDIQRASEKVIETLIDLKTTPTPVHDKKVDIKTDKSLSDTKTLA